MSWTRTERYRTTFMQLLSPKANEKILDVGAGKGMVADLVQRVASSEVYALDSSMKRVEFIQRKHPNLKTCQSSSDSIPYPDGFFDKAYATLAVHHFSDQPKSFKELARVVSPDGLLVIVDLSPRTFLGRINQLWENVILRYHLTFLGFQDLILLLERDGEFKVEETKQLGPAYFVKAVRTNVAAQ